MSVIDIKGTKNKVLYLLEVEKHLRDSDEKLIANIWYADLAKNKIDPSKMSAMEFLKMLADGGLTNCQSIHRARRDLQKSLPELRGEFYKERKSKEEVVKQELRD